MCVCARARACVLSGTLVELRQQIAVEKAMRTRLRAEMQEMDARITRAQIAVADARRSNTSSEYEACTGELRQTYRLGMAASITGGGAAPISTSSIP